MIINLGPTKNLKHIVNCFQSGYRGVLLEGGSRSGKTWAVCQFLIERMLTQKNLVITAGRGTLKGAKDTIWDDMRAVINIMGVSSHFNLIDHKSWIICGTNKMRFIGLSEYKLEKYQGYKQDITWVNESLETPKDVVDTLNIRTNHFMILDYNPTRKKHWCYDLDKRKDFNLCKSTLLDNKFVSKGEKTEILAYEPTEENIAQGTADSYKWNVFGLGLRGVNEQTIYKEWTLFTEAPEEYDIKVYGLDLGYSNAPAAGLELIISGNSIYGTELFYEKGMSAKKIAEAFYDHGYTTSHYCVQDKDDRVMYDLRSHNTCPINAISADKGPGSVKWRNEKVQEMRNFVNTKSQNYINEKTDYSWKKDRYGEILNEPIKEDDHLMDAEGYAATKFLRHMKAA